MAITMNNNIEIKSFNSLVAHFLGKRLPEELANLITFSDMKEEARNFIVRMLSLMQQARFSPTEFTPMLIRAVSEMIPKTLPSAWGGNIPPVTMSGRHQKFDAYVDGHVWQPVQKKKVFIDIGCGFPPQTTLDTARCFPDWQVIGVDRNFAPFIVYDPDGNYACFEHNGQFQYFQPSAGGIGEDLYSNLDETRLKFEKIFGSFSHKLPKNETKTSLTFEKNGHKIIQNYICDFEMDNLTFEESEIDEIQLPPAHVIRCMNVLLYTDNESRKKTMQRLSQFLCSDGIMIVGTNGNDIHARYIVYRKTNNQTAPQEFSFSPDNLRPFGFMPWFTIHENDPEATFLAKLTGVIRADKVYWAEFSRRFDELLAEYRIARRGANGFLDILETELPIAEIIVKMRQILGQIVAEGFVEGAVETLKKSGFTAWINRVGDIAVLPPEKLFTL
jgi:hypothetical protein